MKKTNKLTRTAFETSTKALLGPAATPTEVDVTILFPSPAALLTDKLLVETRLLPIVPAALALVDIEFIELFESNLGPAAGGAKLFSSPIREGALDALRGRETYRKKLRRNGYG